MHTITQQDGKGKAAGEHKPTVLISGASFAGLATAWWMNRLGYAVTIVEVAPTLRKGGTPVDIRESVIDVVKRMGLLERIASRSLPPRPTEFLDAQGNSVLQRLPSAESGDAAAQEYEIERDDLLNMLFDEVKDDVEWLFGDSVARVEESADEVNVTFTSGPRRTFSLLLGCDGTHSAVRRLCFGEESRFVAFLQNYFSLTIVNKLLLEENNSQMFNVPGKTIMLNSYNGKTDIAFCFHAETEIPYDRRNRDQQRQMIQEQFKGVGWKTRDLLDEVGRCDNFYFDQLCQVRMDSWTRGRVALVGDAAYCPSPAAGMGGSMALLGAAALADALQKYPDDLEGAFREYNESFRPAVEEIQRNAVEFGIEMFMPSTEEAIQKRNQFFNAA